MLSLLFLSLFIGVNGNLHGCPNNVTCLTSETCCQTIDGLWSCCPIENGICCSDGLHCCSKDETCLSNGKCSSSRDQISFAFPLRVVSESLKSVPCPDGTSCDDRQTCCQLSSGHYACCPHPDAVCCSDHIHCCPKNHQCEVESGHCKRQIDQLNDVPCPDGSTSCPDGYTCCLLDSGGYGCCPLDDAVCCSDHLHCCPHGQTCDVEHGQCLSQISIPWFTKIPSFTIKRNLTKLVNVEQDIDLSKLIGSTSTISTIQCPDGSYCPEETTCCETNQNSTYGCCPYEQGICCSDKIHCCGNGYLCDKSGNRCIRHFDVHSKFLKKENEMKKLISHKVKEDLICPDGITKCFSNATCCPNKFNNSISYSCCPYSKGVCCGSNGSVCCPNNYDCNEDQLSCELRDSIVLRDLLLTNDYYQCDLSETVCQTDQTCCQTSDLDFACCPYPNGQCCSDGAHCCPLGTICDTELQGCQQV